MSCSDCFFVFKQKTAYDMRISDWSSDVCSSDLFQPCGRISRNFRSKRRIVRKSGMKRIEIVRYGIEQFGFCVLRNRGKQIKCFGYRLVIGISEGKIIRDEPQLVDSSQFVEVAF